MYEDMLKKLIFENLEEYNVSCNKSQLTEDGLSYAEISFTPKQVNSLQGSNIEMTIHKIKCGNCYCKPTLK